MRYETEFDWGGTRIFVSTAIVEGLRCFFIEPRNNFFATPTVYGRYDDEVRPRAQGMQGVIGVVASSGAEVL
jgi:starch synthase